LPMAVFNYVLLPKRQMGSRRKKWSPYYLPTGRIKCNESVSGTVGKLLALDEIADEVGHFGTGDKIAVRMSAVVE
jgi:hypothetical protein